MINTAITFAITLNTSFATTKLKGLTLIQSKKMYTKRNTKMEAEVYFKYLDIPTSLIVGIFMLS